MRVLKFVKYLPSFGWKPVVLTVKPAYHRFIDESLLAEVPGEAVVVHTASLQSKGQSYQRALDRFHGSSDRTKSVLKALRHWLHGYFLVHQDEDFLWLPWAWRAACRIVEENRIDVIMTTSPPHCAQWLGLALWKRYALPWVVDLRDAWTDNEIFRARFPPRRFIEKRVERSVIQHADRVLAATPPILDDLKRSDPSKADRFFLLTNGFDPADFDAVSPRPDRDFLDIAYVGSIGGERRPVTPLLQAVARLLGERPMLDRLLRLRFVGSFGSAESELVDDLDLSSIAMPTGWVDHKDAIQQMLDADVLLVISSQLEGGKDVLTGKVFEYIAAERLILALVPPEAAVGQLIRDHELGLVASATDVDEIYVALCEICERFVSGTLNPRVNPELKRQFNRLEQTRILAQVFGEVVDRVQP